MIGDSLISRGHGGLVFSNDTTKTTILGIAGDYLRIGDAAATSQTLDTNDDLMVTGELEVDGAAFFDGGIHAGGAAYNAFHYQFAGNFTSGGVTNDAVGTFFGGVITGYSGDTDILCGTRMNNTLTTQSVDENIATATQLYLAEPNIVNNLGGGNKPDVASTLHITGAPTEGDTNTAIWVGGGDIKFGGSLDSTAVADQVAIGGYEIGAGNRVLAISQETAVAADTDETKFSNKVQVRINGGTYFIMLTAT